MSAKTSDSFYADLRRGVRYALARRQKLIAYAATAASFLIVNGYVSGTAANICNGAIAVAGLLSVNFARYVAPVAKGPGPFGRATGKENRGLAGALEDVAEQAITGGASTKYTDAVDDPDRPKPH